MFQPTLVLGQAGEPSSDTARAAAMQARQRGRIAVGWSQLARAWRGNMLLVVLELQHDLKLKYSDERRPTRRI